MHAYKLLLGLLAAAASLATGCATAPEAPPAEVMTPAPRTPPRWQRPPEADSSEAPVEAAASPSVSRDVSTPQGPGHSAAASKAPANSRVAPGASAVNPSAGPPPSLQEVMAEIEALGDVNPEVQKRLLEDLRQSDPALWPLMTQQIRATLAYQKQHAAKMAAATSRAPVTRQAAATPVVPGNAPPNNALQRAASADAAKPQPAQTALSNGAAPQASDASSASIAPASPAGATSISAAAGSAPASLAAANQPSAVSPSNVVRQVSFEQPAPEKNETKQPVAKQGESEGDWRAPLAASIAALESQTREPAHDAESTARHAHLRMLYLAAGRRDDALRPIPGIPASQQDYWSKQFFALGAYLDSQGAADPSRRAAEAASHLSQAAASLGQLGPLAVKNLNFCTEVVSYGVFTRFEQSEFKPGQQVLLYAEVENFKSEETSEGFHTALQSSYQILDSQGRRVAHDDFELTEEHCQNRRRDYFIRYFLTLPAMIYEGRYTLELTIEDTLGRKIGQSTIEFMVHGKTK